MSEVTIAGITYVRKDYTPKRRGRPAGHGWVRAVAGASSATGRSQAGLEVNHLVDEVVELRHDLEAERKARVAAEARIEAVRSELDLYVSGTLALGNPGQRKMARRMLAALTGDRR